MKKKIYFMVYFVIIALFATEIAYATSLENYYPHWDLKNKQVREKIEKIENFITANAGKGYIAAFDWDGTLCDEEIKIKERQGVIKAYQPVWHEWAARHFSDTSLNLFPLFKTSGDLKEQVQSLIVKDDYLEGKTNISISDYNKFSQIAIFEAGMTPEEMYDGLDLFFDDYPPSKYVFYPMLDIVQRLTDSGFKVWIVTGSNPYFIASVLDEIEKTSSYDFKISKLPYSPYKDKIVGNAAKLTKEGEFSVVYDDVFVSKNNDDKLYVIQGEGKAVAIKSFIEDKEKNKTIFCAGNTEGDLSMMEYVLGVGSNSLGVVVNPKGKLKELAKKSPEKVIIMDGL